MERLLRRSCVAGIGVVCLLSAGCLHVPYALPEFTYAPSVDAKCKSKDVYVFRVDVTQTMEIKGVNVAVRGETVDHEELTQIRPSSHGTTPSQVGVNLASGWRYVGFWNYTSSSTGHAIGLRFYRPGYETIVLKPGESPSDLQWREAGDLVDQAKALDDLFNVSSTKSTKSPLFTRHALEPGTKSASHRNALQFGAGEYERLAGECNSASEQTLRSDLLSKARRLRSLADGKDRER